MKQSITPARYTLGEAAKATGKSKPTISRAIKKGTISGNKNHNGEYELDPAEVHRVWPLLQPASNDDGTVKQSDTPNNDSGLQREIELLREMVERGDAERSRLEADRDKWREQAERVTLLLEGGRSDEASSGGFFSRLLGRK